MKVLKAHIKEEIMVMVADKVVMIARGEERK